jgi:four helix bundle protein
MPTIKRFEDIRAWQAARELTNFVYKMTKNDLFLNDWGIRNQIRRAAGSSMHNIAEGFDAGSDSEFVRFLGYARRSVSEVQSQLYTALDQKYIDEKEFKKIYDKADQTKRQINGFISYLMKNKSSKKIKDLTEVYTIATDRSD